MSAQLHFIIQHFISVTLHQGSIEHHFAFKEKVKVKMSHLFFEYLFVSEKNAYYVNWKGQNCEKISKKILKVDMRNPTSQGSHYNLVT